MHYSTTLSPLTNEELDADDLSYLYEDGDFAKIDERLDFTFVGADVDSTKPVLNSYTISQNGNENKKL